MILINIPIEVLKKNDKWAFFKDFLNFAHKFEVLKFLEKCIFRVKSWRKESGDRKIDKCHEIHQNLY